MHSHTSARHTLWLQSAPLMVIVNREGAVIQGAYPAAEAGLFVEMQVRGSVGCELRREREAECVKIEEREREAERVTRTVR